MSSPQHSMPRRCRKDKPPGATALPSPLVLTLWVWRWVWLVLGHRLWDQGLVQGLRDEIMGSTALIQRNIAFHQLSSAQFRRYGLVRTCLSSEDTGMATRRSNTVSFASLISPGHSGGTTHKPRPSGLILETSARDTPVWLSPPSAVIVGTLTAHQIAAPFLT